MKPSKLSRRIVEIVTAAGHDWPGGPDNAVIRRTRAGRHQRNCGAWSWFLYPINRDGLFPDVGSQTSAAELVRGPVVVSVELGSVVLDPDTGTRDRFGGKKKS